MMRVKVLAAGAVLAGLSGLLAPLGAQTTVGADLDLFSSYVWRGLSLTNKPVAQPNVYLTVPAGNASVTAGGWASVDLGEYDDPADDFSEGGGTSFNLAEFNPYAEVSFPAGKATLTGGVVGYIYPNDLTTTSNGGLDSEANTWEVYGILGFDVPLAPSVAVYYDVDKINGAYIEGSVSHAVPLNERLSLELGGLVGFSAGQGFDPDSDDSFNFADDGLTHVDFSAGLPLTAGAFSITPVVHLQVSGDDATKLTSPTDDSDVKLWGGVSISWSRALGVVPEAEE